jgi:tRNA/tmRNA/rRNA uracil-C5-methylase (TrmA/RlmC/RlmD family)
VAADEKAGESGKIITFEGSEDAIENLEDTIKLNGVGNHVLVRHASTFWQFMSALQKKGGISSHDIEHSYIDL